MPGIPQQCSRTLKQPSGHRKGWHWVIKCIPEAIPQLPFPADLLRDPDASGMSNPLSGMNPSVDPDSRAIRTASAELEQRIRPQTKV